MKIGNREFRSPEFIENWHWTKSRIIAAVIGGAVLLVAAGILIGRSSTPQTEVVAEQVPPYITDVKLTPELKQTADLWSRGAMLFIFFHEAGHMLITEQNIPAVGPEEDVVDEFSTFFLTDQMKMAPERQKGLYAQIIVAGALFQKISAEQHDVSKFPFYDEHSPDAKRFFNILCLATGADPLRFIPMAVKNGVPESRLASCANEYKKKHAAWMTLIEPHTHGWLARKLHTGGRLKLKIGPVGKAEWLPYEITFRQGGYFQQMLDSFSDYFALPEDVPVEVKTCNGAVNAFWSPDDKQITICHELFDEVVKLFTNALAAEQQRAAQQGEQPSVPQQSGDGYPQGGGQSGGGNAVAFLIGRWICNVVDPQSGMTGTTDTSLAPDGRFTTRSAASNGIQSTGWGRWSAPAMGTIRYDFEGVSPPQLCGPQGCVPNRVQTPYFVQYQVLGPGRVRLPDATCNKAG